jgi:hypothetical protein
MRSRQHHILRVLSSIAVGTMGFCLTGPAALLLGGILFGLWLDSGVLLPARLAFLFIISAFAGVVLGL